MVLDPLAKLGLEVTGANDIDRNVAPSRPERKVVECGKQSDVPHSPGEAPHTHEAYSSAATLTWSFAISVEPHRRHTWWDNVHALGKRSEFDRARSEGAAEYDNMASHFQVQPIHRGLNHRAERPPALCNCALLAPGPVEVDDSLRARAAPRASADNVACSDSEEKWHPVEREVGVDNVVAAHEAFGEELGSAHERGAACRRDHARRAHLTRDQPGDSGTSLSQPRHEPRYVGVQSAVDDGRVVLSHYGPTQMFPLPL